MPKEAAHWILAEHISQAMPDGLIKREISENKALYYLGAIVFDTPYYSLIGQHRSNLAAAVQRLHGHRASSPFNPFRPLAKSPGALPDGYLPFIAGAITHVAVDATFHPLIYYFGGDTDVPSNQAARATTRHRRLETALDLHFLNRNGNAAFRNLLLTGIYKNRENEEGEFLKLLNLLYFGKFLMTDFALRLAFWQHALIHVIMQQRRIHQFLGLFEILFPRQARRLKPIEALFYATCQDEDPHLFLRSLVYRHPVTGEDRQETVSQLQDRTVSLALEFLGQIDNIERQADLKKRLACIAFPSLFNGLPPDPGQKMRFFDTIEPLDL